ncbi:unnamed protein product [Adineta steineri]|uniref:G-protein coupled receptors family 1 profile domain-containing protein n=1 Tax=Adineta steineri TaxID=433720 RepID=A0A813N2J8_9BILA|nr:unnamed protein product [Adineta steineri]CAF3810236.1 unnamed protein product [Adineta steineri]
MPLTIVQLDLIGRYLNIYLGSFMLIAGLLGSCINLWLFTRHRFRKSPCSRFVIASSLFDILHLIVALFLRVLADGFGKDPASSSVIGCRIRYYLITFSAYASLGCRCLASFDRYACTSRSISFREWSSFKIAYNFLIINTFIWICFALPNFLYFNLVPIGPTRVTCTIAKKAYFDYFAYFVNPVLYFSLPLIIIITLAIKTHKNLRLMNKTKRIKRLERQMASMIILQAITNSISSIPYGIQFFYSVITFTSEKDEYRRAQENLFLQITRLSYYINFISAFYIYYVSSKQIRSTIRRTILRQKKLSTPSTSSSSSSKNQFNDKSTSRKSFK